jgi:hypothetical protein
MTSLRNAGMLLGMGISLASALLSPPAAADTGSAAFDRYLQDLRGRLQAADNASGWISSEVDHAAFERHLAAMRARAGEPGMTDTATFLAGANVQPLRTFNTYLAYLGQRMRVDAGAPGELLKTHKGTDPFDRYLEEINYRIQALYQAEDSTGF